jgi:two-component system, cell cycle sensor histidine kinase and response regulator CckA
MVMPGMSGRELAQRLLALCPGVRCLYMSDYTPDVIAHRGMLEEGASFVRKPLSPPGLAAKVREILAREGHTNWC